MTMLLDKYSSEETKETTWFSAWQAAHRAQLLTHGLPTRKNERWKYADFDFLKTLEYEPSRIVDPDLIDIIQQYRLTTSESILLVFVNGQFISYYSDLHKLPGTVIACTLQEAMRHHSSLLQQQLKSIDTKKYPLAGLNIAAADDGFFLYVPDDCEISLPIHLVSIPFGDSFTAHPKRFFVLGNRSKLTLLDEYFSLKDNAYCINLVSQFQVGEEAHLDYYKLQQEGKLATHLAHTFVAQQTASEVSLHHAAVGAQFARDEIAVVLAAPQSICRTTGFYYLERDQQYIDYHIDIHHAASHTQSEMLYKGIVNHKARAVFNGRLQVAKDTHKIVAHQANHHLILSRSAEAYSKPELEIYADDVKCKHGATTGQLDQDALFYLQARGIPRAEATQMLLQAFAEENISRMSHAAIKKYIKGVVAYETKTF